MKLCEFSEETYSKYENELSKIYENDEKREKYL